MKVLTLTKDGLKKYEPPKLAVRQILRFFGPGMNETGRWAIYSDPAQKPLKVVNIDFPDFLRVASFVKPISEKFGIGWYYEEPAQFATEEQIKRGLAMAEKYQKEQDEKARRERNEREEAFSFFSGNEPISIPQNKMAVTITAYFDDSDISSDFFHDHARISDHFLLAILPKGRQDEAKLRKIISKIPALQKFNWTWHKENWSGGHGYYLQSDIIGKVPKNAYDGRKEVSFWLEIQYDKWTKEFKKSKLFIDDNASHKIPSKSIEIVEYSERAIAVFGDTKPIKDKLKAMGGRFNPYLKKNGQRCAGWIFSKKVENKLKQVLKEVK